jgi:hypothetical protein
MTNNNSRDNSFTIYNKILDFTNYTELYIINNIPAIKRDLRIHFLDESYMLSKNMFYAIYSKGNIRMKYLIELQVTISLIDMMLVKMTNISNIPNKHINSATSKLGDIKNLVYAWKLNEEKSK